ncbi:MAG TPA: hypothetical protein PLA44_14035 [Propionibacteriaceae bacterium]|nr:hypothetical protein [Propionibacteriaceae bacterium]
MTQPTTWDEAVAVLTRAVRATRTRADGTVEPDDFAGFLASVLAAVAANVGGVRRVTAGRPGSWESDLVHRLLAGTVEDSPEALALHRTAPVRVPLSVAQLVEHASVTGSNLLTFDAAEQAIPWPGTGDGTQEHPWGEGATAAELESREAHVVTLSARYAAAYQHYADQFTAAVHEAAKALNLSVQVEVVTDTDPDGFELDNPHEWLYGDDDTDPLVWQLWSAARDRAGLPVLDGTDAG